MTLQVVDSNFSPTLALQLQMLPKNVKQRKRKNQVVYESFQQQQNKGMVREL